MEVVYNFLLCSKLLMVNLIEVVYFEKYYQKAEQSLSTKHIIVLKHHQKKAVTFYEYVSFAVVVANVKKKYSKNSEWPTYLENSIVS